NGRYSCFNIAVAGYHHHWKIRVLFFNFVKQSQPIKPASLQPDVQKHQTRDTVVNGGQCTVSIKGSPCFIPFVTQDPGYKFPNIDFIVNDKNICCHINSPVHSCCSTEF